MTAPPKEIEAEKKKDSALDLSLTRRAFCKAALAAFVLREVPKVFAGEEKTESHKREIQKMVPPKKESDSEDNKERRILVLGGGGTTALRVEVEGLIDLFGPDKKGHDVLKELGHPDVWCTSAGAITGAGLAANYTLAEIRDMSRNEDFLQNVIYIKKEKGEARSPGGDDAPCFVKPKNAEKLSSGERLKDKVRDFIIAGFEMSAGPTFSTQRKTQILGQAIGRELSPDRPAAQAIPSLQDRKMAGLGDKPLSVLKEVTGCHFAMLF